MYVNQFLAAVYKIQYAFNTLSMVQMTSHMYPQQTPKSNAFDFIIIGSGSAGSVVANRLTEIPNVSVLLIDACGDPPLESNLPGFTTHLVNSSIDWGQVSVQNETAYPCMENHQMPLSRGCGLGGGSSINMMYYVRGNPADLDEWAHMTNDTSWNSTNLLPYYKKSQRLEEPSILRSDNGKFHGTDGYLGVTLPHKEVTTEYFEAFEEIGINKLPDASGVFALGVSEQMVTVSNGLRQSTANAFLSPIKDRPNLFVLKHTLVIKIIFDENNRAIAVLVKDQNNKTYEIKANKEIILSAGTINSAHLLLLSGVGPKEDLEKFGIPVVADLPVGKNLQNHYSLNLIYKMDKLRPAPPFNPEEFPMATVSGYWQLDDNIRSLFQILGQIFPIDGFMVFCNFVFSYKRHICEYYYKELMHHEIFMLTIVKARSNSRGYVSLNSVDPHDTPKVFMDPNESADDFEDKLRYMDHMNQLLNTTYFRSVNATLVKLPPCDAFEDGSMEYKRCYMRCAATSFFHFSSTCAMGPVATSRGLVQQIKGLRMADASIMPMLISANTNAPAMMIGEKISDMIKEDHNLLT